MLWRAFKTISDYILSNSLKFCFIQICFLSIKGLLYYIFQKSFSCICYGVTDVFFCEFRGNRPISFLSSAAFRNNVHTKSMYKQTCILYNTLFALRGPQNRGFHYNLKFNISAMSINFLYCTIPRTVYNCYEKVKTIHFSFLVPRQRREYKSN